MMFFHYGEWIKSLILIFIRYKNIARQIKNSETSKQKIYKKNSFKLKN